MSHRVIDLQPPRATHPVLIHNPYVEIHRYTGLECDWSRTYSEFPMPFLPRPCSLLKPAPRPMGLADTTTVYTLLPSDCVCV